MSLRLQWQISLVSLRANLIRFKQSGASNNSSSASRSARSLYCCSFLICSCLVGCGNRNSGDRLQVFPVEGKVTLAGQPLANALIVFHPKEKSNPKTATARATSDANGEFRATTYLANDGAPAGDYDVTVECYKLKGSGTSFEPGPNILAKTISQPSSTNIHVTIAAGPNALKPFDLKR